MKKSELLWILFLSVGWVGCGDGSESGKDTPYSYTKYTPSTYKPKAYSYDYGSTTGKSSDSCSQAEVNDGNELLKAYVAVARRLLHLNALHDSGVNDWKLQLALRKSLKDKSGVPPIYSKTCTVLVSGKSISIKDWDVMSAVAARVNEIEVVETRTALAGLLDELTNRSTILLDRNGGSFSNGNPNILDLGKLNPTVQNSSAIVYLTIFSTGISKLRPRRGTPTEGIIEQYSAIVKRLLGIAIAGNGSASFKDTYTTAWGEVPGTGEGAVDPAVEKQNLIDYLNKLRNDDPLELKYDVLPSGADDADVKRAYKRAILKLHTDRLPALGVAAGTTEYARREALFKKLQNRYELWSK
jgi:hypothetical protein